MADDDKSRHDFKNQLAIIRGFSEILLAEAAAGDPRRRDLEEIHKAAVTALDLVERLYPRYADTLQERLTTRFGVAAAPGLEILGQPADETSDPGQTLLPSGLDVKLCSTGNLRATSGEAFRTPSRS